MQGPLRKGGACADCAVHGDHGPSAVPHVGAESEGDQGPAVVELEVSRGGWAREGEVKKKSAVSGLCSLGDEGSDESKAIDSAPPLESLWWGLEKPAKEGLHHSR